MDVVRAALQVALYYGIEAEVETIFARAYAAMAPATEGSAEGDQPC